MYSYISKVIFSLLVPPKVKNVRVYTYSPIRNRTSITGLVVWDRWSTTDAGGVVKNYYVNVSDATNGNLLTSDNVLIVSNKNI